mmetsp:Transcript_11979/g.33834  ORF Transcript_11979/g.33834 Transcript_11979/m.33834 type:complete len:354 (-) Transcript_11979:69-1130(-)
MSHLGGFIFGMSSSNAAWSFSCAGFIKSVWKAPEVLSSLACMAPAFSTSSFSFPMALVVPAQEKPLGKRRLAIWQVSPPTACSLQSFSSVSWSTPKTESMDCGLELAASAMACPLTFTSCIPSSKVNTPAAHKAVYSPRERPATAPGRSTASGRDSRSLTRPAMPPRNMQGWQTLVSSSLSSGPLRQTSRGFQPRTASAVATICCTSGLSSRLFIMFTYCEPWPGKISASVVGGGPEGCSGAANWSAGMMGDVGTSTFFGMKCSGLSSAALTLAARTCASRRCSSSAACLTEATASSTFLPAACTCDAEGATVRPLPTPRRPSEVRASSAAARIFLLASPAATASSSVLCAAS